MSNLASGGNFLADDTPLAGVTGRIVGEVLGCDVYDHVTLFVKYVKGDEDVLYVTPFSLPTIDGDAYQFQTWDAVGAIRTRTKSKFSLTATDNYLITFDIRGIEFIKFQMDTEGGTPSGTVKVQWSMTGG
jgi:hypothetical protein